MSTNDHHAASSHTWDDDGTLIFWWESIGRLELPPVPVDRRGAHLAKVYPTQNGGRPLTVGRVRWDSLHDRQQLAQHCLPKDDEALKAWLTRFVEVATIVSEAGERERAVALPLWPTCPKEAYHGVMGEVATTVKPVTEADASAILVQGLVLAGAIFDTKVYYQVGATRHPPREFVVVVGRTGEGRKAAILILEINWSRTALLAQGPGS